MINRLKVHEFHFVLNNSLKAKLYSLSRIMNLNLSKTIIFILEKSYLLIKKMHLLDFSKKNKIEKINWDSHLHIYFPEKKTVLYNELKSIHKDNDTYSIAGELRYLLKLFIRGVEMYGFERFLLILEKAQIKFKNIIRRKKIWIKKRVRQLSEKHYLLVQYDINYKAIFIKLLN
jgi:hypothetical protein